MILLIPGSLTLWKPNWRFTTLGMGRFRDFITFLMKCFNSPVREKHLLTQISSSGLRIATLNIEHPQLAFLPLFLGRFVRGKGRVDRLAPGTKHFLSVRVLSS